MADNISTTFSSVALPPRVPSTLSSRITVPEIAKRLDLGRQAVYQMLEQHIIPGIHLGKRWIVTRYAYETWERSAGMRAELSTKVQ